jgi:putative colanic acid biosynthesis UDP-glucose lipid carrier transferase
MQKRTSRFGYGRYLPFIFSCVDLLIINIAFFVMLYCYPEIAQVGHSLRVIWIFANICFIPAMWNNLRQHHAERAIRMDYVLNNAFSAIGIHALTYLSIITLLHVNIIPLNAFFTFYALAAVALVIWSIISRRVIKKYRRRGYNFIRVVIIGTNSVGRRLYEQMLTDDGFGYKVMGFFDENEPDDELASLYRGDVDKLEEFVKQYNIDQIFFALPGIDDDFTTAIKVADDNVTEFYYVPQITSHVNRRFELHAIGSIPVMNTLSTPLRNVVNRIIKRTFDIIVSSIFLCFYPLIYIPIALTIKITSPGPVYFKQERTGYKGKSFQCLKFRSMHVNKDSDKQQATKNDPRKTRFGEFLRHSSLDELPQFINVWRGDMSIVGPRPHMLKHTEEYAKLIDRYMVRHYVRPGITGWAQVNGYRGLTDELWKMEKRVEYDVWYIEHWSLSLDLKIMVRTVINAVRGEKNAF